MRRLRHCGNCRFCKKTSVGEDLDVGDGYGECHRNAPFPTNFDTGKIDPELSARWSVVYWFGKKSRQLSDWCGEWRTAGKEKIS